MSKQTDGMGRPIPMTLGWHIGNGTAYFFKEGGGGGFHSEMRVYNGGHRIGGDGKQYPVSFKYVPERF